MTDNPRRRFDPFVAFLAFACVALAVVAFLLARQNRSLKAQLSGNTVEAPHPAEPPN
jgi:hypothetical protein